MQVGLPASTPAVAVQSASRATELHCFGTLASLPALLADQHFDGPTRILIGEVVGLAHETAATVSEAA